ncbi:MAG: AraC family transcriptional regulator [Oscillospiraceae bacterium]|nr:AraC family transcriptional regulator [Oscillospiraceae bacterium]
MGDSRWTDAGTAAFRALTLPQARRQSVRQNTSREPTFNAHIQANHSLQPFSLMTNSHWHDDIEIIYQKTAQSVLIIDGEYVELEPGELAFINSREAHIIYGRPDCAYLCFRFDPDVLYGTARSSFAYRYIHPLSDQHQRPQKKFSRQELQNSGLPELLEDAFQELSHRRFAYELAVRADATRISLWILRRWEQAGMITDRENELDEQDMALLQKVCDYVDQNYAQPVQARDAARLCQMSYSYFSRFFKRCMGTSFTAYLNRVRLLEAEKRLLRSTDSVTEIAEKVGYTSLSYFIACFKESKGMSPLQFRKSLKPSDQRPVRPAQPALILTPNSSGGSKYV